MAPPPGDGATINSLHSNEGDMSISANTLAQPQPSQPRSSGTSRAVGRNQDAAGLSTRSLGAFSHSMFGGSARSSGDHKGKNTENRQAEGKGGFKGAFKKMVNKLKPSKSQPSTQAQSEAASRQEHLSSSDAREHSSSNGHSSEDQCHPTLIPYLPNAAAGHGTHNNIRSSSESDWDMMGQHSSQGGQNLMSMAMTTNVATGSLATQEGHSDAGHSVEAAQSAAYARLKRHKEDAEPRSFPSSTNSRTGMFGTNKAAPPASQLPSFPPAPPFSDKQWPVATTCTPNLGSRMSEPRQAAERMHSQPEGDEEMSIQSEASAPSAYHNPPSHSEVKSGVNLSDDLTRRIAAIQEQVAAMTEEDLLDPRRTGKLQLMPGSQSHAAEYPAGHEEMEVGSVDGSGRHYQPQLAPGASAFSGAAQMTPQQQAEVGGFLGSLQERMGSLMWSESMRGAPAGSGQLSNTPTQFPTKSTGSVAGSGALLLLGSHHMPVPRSESSGGFVQRMMAHKPSLNEPPYSRGSHSHMLHSSSGFPGDFPILLGSQSIAALDPSNAANSRSMLEEAGIVPTMPDVPWVPGSVIPKNMLAMPLYTGTTTDSGAHASSGTGTASGVAFTHSSLPASSFISSQHVGIPSAHLNSMQSAASPAHRYQARRQSNLAPDGGMTPWYGTATAPGDDGARSHSRRVAAQAQAEMFGLPPEESHSDDESMDAMRAEPRSVSKFSVLAALTQFTSPSGGTSSEQSTITGPGGPSPGQSSLLSSAPAWQPAKMHTKPVKASSHLGWQPPSDVIPLQTLTRDGAAAAGAKPSGPGWDQAGQQGKQGGVASPLGQADSIGLGLNSPLAHSGRYDHVLLGSGVLVVQSIQSTASIGGRGQPAQPHSGHQSASGGGEFQPGSQDTIEEEESNEPLDGELNHKISSLGTILSASQSLVTSRNSTQGLVDQLYEMHSSRDRASAGGASPSSSKSINKLVRRRASVVTFSEAASMNARAGGDPLRLQALNKQRHVGSAVDQGSTFDPFVSANSSVGAGSSVQEEALQRLHGTPDVLGAYSSLPGPGRRPRRASTGPAVPTRRASRMGIQAQQEQSVASVTPLPLPDEQTPADSSVLGKAWPKKGVSMPDLQVKSQESIEQPTTSDPYTPELSPRSLQRQSHQASAAAATDGPPAAHVQPAAAVPGSATGTVRSSRQSANPLAGLAAYLPFSTTSILTTGSTAPSPSLSTVITKMGSHQQTTPPTQPGGGAGTGPTVHPSWPSHEAAASRMSSSGHSSSRSSAAVSIKQLEPVLAAIARLGIDVSQVPIDQLQGMLSELPRAVPPTPSSPGAQPFRSPHPVSISKGSSPAAVKAQLEMQQSRSAVTHTSGEHHWRSLDKFPEHALQDPSTHSIPLAVVRHQPSRRNTANPMIQDKAGFMEGSLGRPSVASSAAAPQEHETIPDVVMDESGRPVLVPKHIHMGVSEGTASGSADSQRRNSASTLAGAGSGAGTVLGFGGVPGDGMQPGAGGAVFDGHGPGSRAGWRPSGNGRADWDAGDGSRAASLKGQPSDASSIKSASTQQYASVQDQLLAMLTGGEISGVSVDTTRGHHRGKPAPVYRRYTPASNAAQVPPSPAPPAAAAGGAGRVEMVLMVVGGSVVLLNALVMLYALATMRQLGGGSK